MATNLYQEQRKARKALRLKKEEKVKEEEKKKEQSVSFIFNQNANQPLSKAKDSFIEEIKKEIEEPVKLSEIDQIDLLKQKIEEEKKIELQRKDKDNWDVKIGDVIEFFDPELSYQITGYRPITMTKGLDFDPEPFMKIGQVFLETGNYTTYVKGSKLYVDFWKEQMDRCTNGCTIGRYTITGDHYFFLNFYRLLNIKNVKKAATGRLESFPDFYAKQYEYFHYIALCEHLGKDIGALKARGVGFSEIAASLGVRLYTTTANSISTYAAFSDNFVEKVLDKCWLQMEFLNTKTNGGFKRVRMGKSTNRLRKASVIDKEKNETGHLAVIQGVTIDNPRKLRGDRMERIFFEESGSNPHLITTYNQAEALVNIQGTRFGVRFVWGTGGDSGPALAGLAKMFYEPESFNMLPYKHNHTQTGEYVYTAFFVPAYSMVTKFCDHRGVCDEIEAKQYYNTERLKKSSDPQNLLEYKSEYCFYPEEALIREGSNRFDSALLAEQIANIELHKLVELPRNARLTYPYNRDIGTIDYSQSPKLEYHSSGKIQIIEEPIKDDNDIPYANLYVVGIDGIDADKSTSSGQKDVSNFAVVVKRRALGLMEPKYVAIYKDRPKDIREAHIIALALCEYYNAKAMVEATRVSVITFFKEKKKSNLLFRRPKAVSATISKTNSNQFGCPAVQQYIDHELDLIECYINDYYYNIHHLELLQELIKYSYENKRKFDLVAAMQMAELADEEMMGKTPKRISQSTEGWRDIGYYIDEYGIKRYGVIPKDVNNNRKKQYDKSYRWLRTQNI